MQQSDRAGLAFALAGFAVFTIGDALIKGMSGMWSPLAMATARYAIAALGLAAILVAREGVQALRMPRPGLQWVRGAGASVSIMAMFTAVTLMPLAEATTITFTQPMITAVLAALFLGERLRMPAIVATLVAFGGVVIVLRPNVEVIGLAALLPLLAAASMSVLMIANRGMVGTASALAMQFYVAVTATIVLLIGTVAGHFSGVGILELHWPHWSVWARCAFVAFSATLGHYLVYSGTMRAGAATVAPASYGQLLMAVLLGWIFFENVPDLLSLLGAAIIVGSGLFLWWNGQARPAPTR